MLNINIMTAGMGCFYINHTNTFSETGGVFFRPDPCSEVSSPAEMLLTVTPGSALFTAVPSSHKVKLERLPSALMVGDIKRSDSQGWSWELMSWVKDSCKTGHAVRLLTDSSVLKFSGDCSDSDGFWVEGVETMGFQPSGCPSGELHTWCLGR